MALLSAADLAFMQGVVVTSLPDTCSIQRPTNTDDGAGGHTTSWVTVQSGIACRIEAYSGRKGGDEDVVNARFESVMWWRVHLPAATDVRITDRILSGSHTFEVKSVDGPRSWETQRDAYCVEIT